MISNRQILAAVLSKWAQPAIRQIAAAKCASIPFLAALNNKVRSTGWVSPQWRLEQEIAPMLDGLSAALVEPFILSQLGGLDDASIPQMAHGIVDEALKHGQLSLFEGNIVFEPDDLRELKTLLNYNLPIERGEVYKVITENPAATAAAADNLE